MSQKIFNESNNLDPEKEVGGEEGREKGREENKGRRRGREGRRRGKGGEGLTNEGMQSNDRTAIEEVSPKEDEYKSTFSLSLFRSLSLALSLSLSLFLSLSNTHVHTHAHAHVCKHNYNNSVY